VCVTVKSTGLFVYRVAWASAPRVDPNNLSQVVGDHLCCVRWCSSVRSAAVGNGSSFSDSGIVPATV
jgi:hypothetical protein